MRIWCQWSATSQDEAEATAKNGFYGFEENPNKYRHHKPSYHVSHLHNEKMKLTS